MQPQEQHLVHTRDLQLYPWDPAAEYLELLCKAGLPQLAKLMPREGKALTTHP